MVSSDKAQKIANEWIEAWNSHDLASILSHYSEDVEFTSPFVVKLLGDKSDTIRGKDALRSYFEKGLSAYPGLVLEPLRVLTGVDSITIYYRSVMGMPAVEAMILDKEGKITKVIVHYSDE